jgi:FtsZ-interacting cell division protein ZipA
VPLAPVAAQPLRLMFAAASLIALDLGAQIVDDNGQAVDAASLSSVEQSLAELYERMRQAGYEPGSPRALRLYA